MTDIEYNLLISKIDTFKYKKNFIELIRKYIINLNNNMHFEKKKEKDEFFDKKIKYFKIISKAYKYGGDLTLPKNINNTFDKQKISILSKLLQSEKTADEINNIYEYIDEFDSASEYYTRLDIFDVENLFVTFDEIDFNSKINITYYLEQDFKSLKSKDKEQNILIYLEYLKIKYEGKKMILLNKEINKFKNILLSNINYKKKCEISFSELKLRSERTAKALNNIYSYIKEN